MLSNKEIICPDNLLNVAHKKKGVKAGIVNAGKPLPMQSVQDAVKENLIEPIFIGDEKEININNNFVKFDGSKYYHESTDFKGIRISLVFFHTKQKFKSLKY